LKGRKRVAKLKRRKSKARTATKLSHGQTVDVYVGRRWVAGSFEKVIGRIDFLRPWGSRYRLLDTPA
jgi:hypothetical protein